MLRKPWLVTLIFRDKHYIKECFISEGSFTPLVLSCLDQSQTTKVIYDVSYLKRKFILAYNLSSAHSKLHTSTWTTGSFETDSNGIKNTINTPVKTTDQNKQRGQGRTERHNFIKKTLYLQQHFHFVFSICDLKHQSPTREGVGNVHTHFPYLTMPSTLEQTRQSKKGPTTSIHSKCILSRDKPNGNIRTASIIIKINKNNFILK